MFLRRSLFTVITVFILSSCGGGSSSATSAPEELPVEVQAFSVSGSVTVSLDSGVDLDIEERTNRDFDTKNKPIASVCHGIQVLVAADIVKNKTCSAYPACAPEVNMSGGTWTDIGFESAIIDGNLVTAAAWPAHPDWLAKFHSMLK